VLPSLLDNVCGIQQSPCGSVKVSGKGEAGRKRKERTCAVGSVGCKISRDYEDPREKTHTIQTCPPGSLGECDFTFLLDREQSERALSHHPLCEHKAQWRRHAFKFKVTNGQDKKRSGGHPPIAIHSPQSGKGRADGLRAPVRSGLMNVRLSLWASRVGVFFFFACVGYGLYGGEV